MIAVDTHASAAAAHRRVPIRALEKGVQDGSPAKGGMQRQSTEEALKRVGASGGEVCAETIAAKLRAATHIKAMATIIIASIVIVIGCCGGGGGGRPRRLIVHVLAPGDV
ncbi:hypothetical protein CDD80_5959 [Ophiocordyceps camponoti-rufipedis]|uniref:Uncharacterized protein n=1 Tax=Ophiocordyceps camponoti-rufipedis TaxID=2004952 RepID=A0A2C5YSK7_9HYPO|nr:hypothetical protein CDD80_5959 [Ophiocordyceps camponoti-rufipedis]